jgi:peptide/nickel transport system substrate-binding protein
MQFSKVLRENCTRPLFLGLFLLIAPACHQPPPEPGIITVAIYTSPNNLDPRYGTDAVSARAHQLLFNNLVNLDDKMLVVPGLASRWDTQDYRTYRFALRRGVRFHDGHELTARDVVYTFKYILDPKSSSPLRGAFQLVESVTAIDPYTVEFVLKDATGSFMVNLVAVRIVPDGAGRDLREHPVGTGPYQFVRYLVDDRLELKAFPDYFEGLPRNRGVVLKVVPDDIMRALELRKHTADLVVNDMAPDMAYQLQKEGMQLHRFPGSNYQYLGFNMRDPILQDVRVRHAIGYAIDRLAIVTYLRRGLATPAISLISPANWAFEPNVFDFTYDPDQARRLLDEAGYRDPDLGGPRPRFTLSLKVSNTEFNRLQSAVIQQNLREVGIDLDLRTYEFATLYADIIKGNFQMYTLQWAAGASADPDILRRVFHSQQVPPAGFNRGHLKDELLDRLIDEATLATTIEERRVLYGRVQQRIAELAPYISLWYETNIAIADPKIQGVHLTPQGDFGFLRNVSR